MIVGKSSQKPTGPYSIAITFGQSDTAYSEIDYLTNQSLAKSIFDRAYAGVLSSNAPIYNKRRLKKRYRKRPPVE